MGRICALLDGNHPEALEDEADASEHLIMLRQLYWRTPSPLHWVQHRRDESPNFWNWRLITLDRLGRRFSP